MDKNIELLKLRIKCRIRGLSLDIENQENKDFYIGAKQEFEILLRHLEKMKYIKADIECAWKYLNDNERRLYNKLVGRKND